MATYMYDFSEKAGQPEPGESSHSPYAIHGYYDYAPYHETAPQLPSPELQRNVGPF